MSLTSIKIVQHKQRLDALFEKGTTLANDSELLSNWAKYLCVLTSGFIEESVRVLLFEYVHKRSSPEVEHFVNSRLHFFQNAKMSNILDLLGEFSSEFRTQMELLAQDELKDAVDSVVNNRHQISHGRPIGLSFMTIKDYYKRVVRTIECLEQVLSNSNHER